LKRIKRLSPAPQPSSQQISWMSSGKGVAVGGGTGVQGGGVGPPGVATPGVASPGHSHLMQIVNPPPLTPVSAQ
jgi:hypothetical protein